MIRPLTVYLVVGTNGIHGAYLDFDQAEVIARAIEAVITSVPVIADYRARDCQGELRG